MLSMISFIVLMVLSYVSGRTTESYINCDATSKNRQTDTFIYQRATLMGSNTPVDYNPSSPLVEYDSSDDGSIQITFLHSGTDCLVHTNDGTLELVSGDATLPSNNACDSWNDILYSVDDNAVVSWQPRSESSMIWVLEGSRPTTVSVQSYSAMEIYDATSEPTRVPTPYPVEPITEPPVPVVTLFPTLGPTTSLPTTTPTPAPSSDVGSSAPQQVGGGSLDEESRTLEETKDAIFGITVVALTGFYISFLWSTLG